MWKVLDRKARLRVWSEAGRVNLELARAHPDVSDCHARADLRIDIAVLIHGHRAPGEHQQRSREREDDFHDHHLSRAIHPLQPVCRLARLFDVRTPFQPAFIAILRELKPEGVLRQLTNGDPMKRKDPRSTTPPHDYRAALHSALSWLGDGYLLAEPVARLNEARTPYFTEQRRWHPAVWRVKAY
jgi:hypothetical protein